MAHGVPAASVPEADRRWGQVGFVTVASWARSGSRLYAGSPLSPTSSPS